MENYKSWSELNKQLTDNLCDDFKDRITYFLTRYHSVHNSYGRAAIRLDGKELAAFSWIEMYRQESDISTLYEEDAKRTYDEMKEQLKPKWDKNCEYCEMDFLNAALKFRNMMIKDALESENYIIRIFAILDRRIGKRTLKKIKEVAEFEEYPAWVRQFYILRLS